MEFETNTQPTEDAVRLAASTRQHTIQPISTAVLPDAVEATDAIARLSATARTKNPENDSEDTAIQQQRYQRHAMNTGSQPKKTVLFTSTIAACLFFAAFLWLATQ